MLVVDGEQTLAAESTGTRLGAGLAERGNLDPDAKARTLAVIADYLIRVRGFDASVGCIATSAMRRASDGAAFAREVATLVGIAPRVLGGDEEATYSFLGATRKLRGDAPVGVLDVGGGSTELAVDSPAHSQRTGHVARTLSLEIGAVRLSERHPALLGARVLDEPARSGLIAEARADAAAILAPLAAEGPIHNLVVVGGTAFTAAAMVAQAPLRDGVAIAAADRIRLVDMLLARDLDARRALPFIRPQRADILPAGILVVDEACRLLQVDAVRVSVDDLLAGYLYAGTEARSPPGMMVE